MHSRTATERDAGSIRAVARAGWHAAYDSILGAAAVETTVDAWYGADRLQERICSRKNDVLVATDSGSVVGFVDGRPTPNGPRDATVAALYVSPDRWGEGVGSGLLRTLFDRFRNGGHETVWLAVLEENDIGRSFYTSHGFTRFDRRVADLPAGSASELVLTRTL